MGSVDDSAGLVISNTMREFLPPIYNIINIDLNAYNPKPFQNIDADLCQEYCIGPLFNSCSLITTISFCTGNINPYFNLKNILLTSFPNFIFITIFSVIYGILIELPLRYFTNEFIFIKHIKNK